MRNKLLYLLAILPISIGLCSCDLQVEDPKHQHTPVIVEGVAPTCTQQGYSAGTVCSTCGETLQSREVIPATGHTIVIDPEVAATCTEDGLTYGAHCEVCGEIIIKQNVTMHTGHYILGLAAKSPTCTETGLTGGAYCQTCGEILEAQEVLPALGHNYSVTVSHKDATCTTDGHTEQIECARCGEIFIESHTIEHQGHTVVTDYRKEPTCTATGLTLGSHCSTCGEVIVAQEVIPALGHDYVITNHLDATCTQDGHTEGLSCSRCHTVFSESHTIFHTGHTAVTDYAKEPTCTTTGLTLGSHCSTCGEIIVAQEVIPALGHDLIIEEAVNPTCTGHGHTLDVHCSRCTYVASEKTDIAPLGHTKGEFVRLETNHITGVNNPGVFKCTVCHEEYYDEIKTNDIDFPIMSINGEFNNIDVTQKWHFDVNYSTGTTSIDAVGVLNWQNEYSSNFSKKNYDITFYEDSTLTSKKGIEFNNKWGTHSTYALKADYLDCSHLRNLGTASLYEQIAATRTSTDEINGLSTYGVTEGEPVLVYQNGDFQGLYTINIPKDNWMFNMNGDSTTHEAVLTAKSWTNSNRLLEHIEDDFSNGWSLDYVSTPNDSSWVVSSFNNMIDFITNNTGEAFKNGISTYANVERTIDTMLLTWLSHGSENYARNITWITYDGVKWTPTLFNLEATWGLNGTGELTINPTGYMAYAANELWNKVFSTMYDDIRARWTELRSSCLSISNITNTFTELSNKLPLFIVEADNLKWSTMPELENNNLSQIINFADECGNAFDLILLN